MHTEVVNNPQGQYEIDIDDNDEPLAIRTRVYTGVQQFHCRKLWERNGKPMTITARCAWNAYRRKIVSGDFS